MNPAQVLEKKQSYPILIVDKTGEIGEQLVSSLKEESLIVFVSQKTPDKEDNIIHIPFDRQLPKIPENIYSHILLVDDGLQTTREALSVFAKKQDDDKGSFIYITFLNNIKQKNVDLLLQKFHRAKVLICGDIFNNDENILFKSLASKYIYQARTEGRIDVPGDGTASFYPVSFKDSIAGILEATFAGEKKNLFYIFSKNPTSYLAFAHAIQKAFPFIKIDFIKENGCFSNMPEYDGEYVLGNNYPLSSRIREVEILDFINEKKQPFVEKKKVKFESTKKKKRGFLKLILFCLFLILLPALSTALSSIIGLETLRLSKDSLEKGDLNSAIKYSEESSLSLSAANFFFTPLFLEGSLIGQENSIANYGKEIEMGKEMAVVEKDLLSTILLLNITGNNKNQISSQNLIAALNTFRSSFEAYEKESVLNKGTFKIPTEYDPILNFASSTLGVSPDILGFYQKKEYLVLLQNNMELRPGGGFIGSYGILKVDKGKITDFTIHDVYDADGQLKGHVEPPFAIRRYMKIPHWYLRDSNFDVDFSKAAATSAYFLNLETGEKVNGVIAIDVSFVKNLLKTIGPVYVDDYKETVTSDNLFLLTETHAEKNSFPGSRQKKEFLSSLFSSIQNKVSKEKGLPYSSLAIEIGKSLTEKHLLFAFDDQSTQDLFSVNGWSSALPAGNFKTNELDDFFGINEANIGVNKANYFIKRSVEKSVTIASDGQINSTLNISYNNTSKGAWPGGDYVNYLRIILPEGANINDITIDNIKQQMTPAIEVPSQYEATSFKPPLGLEIEKYTESGKTIYGFLTTVTSGKIKTIKITYTLAQKIDINSPDFIYNLNFFKQPGTDNYPLALSVNLPPSLSFIDLSSNFTKSGNQAIFSADIDSDLIFSAKIGK